MHQEAQNADRAASAATGSNLCRQRQTAAILSLSRVAWEYAVEPVLTSSTELLDRAGVVWAFGVAEALFPLVALVCRGVAAAPHVVPRPRAAYEEVHSHHFDLRCAALAGSASCVRWILRHRSHDGSGGTRECLSVLWGLCGGGHLAMAQQLVDGGPGEPSWARAAGLAWPAGENDLRDEVRAVDVGQYRDHDDTLLSEACRAGHLETAKWVASRFRLRDNWDLAAPFAAAVAAGRLDVAQWMWGSFGVGWAFNTLGFDYPCGFSFGGNLEMIKWLVGLFPEGWKWGASSETSSPMVFAWGVLSNRGLTLRERIEAFQWLKSYFHFDQPALQTVTDNTSSVESLKWLLDTQGVQLTGSIRWWWREVEGLESVEWVVEHFPISIKPDTFVEACGNFKDDLNCVKVLSRVVNLTPAHRKEALIKALTRCNITVANWLESTFSVMEKNVGADTEQANSALLTLCRGYYNYGDVRGIKWFFRHIPVSIIKEVTVAKALCASTYSVLAFLLNLFAFPAQSEQIKRQWLKALATALDDQGGWSPLLTQIVSHGGLTPGEVSFRIHICEQDFCCSKVLKRLIHEFHITEQLVNKGVILSKLMESGKTRCAEWFIHHFHVNLAEVSKTGDISFPMWKMLLKVFPEVTGENLLTTGNLIGGLLTTPVHLEYAMRNRGLSQEVLAEIFHDLPPSSAPTRETLLWFRKFILTRSSLWAKLGH
ncbi:hypothetical protein Pelo_2070 [Pelomyxa schiedti]|nr:hypothetical protein Pelo_2070 [Pelomyxa schiedti]